MKKFVALLSLATALTAPLSGTALGAEEYAKGTGALEVFDREAIVDLPMLTKVWLVFMLTTFAVGLFVFAVDKPIARWAGGGLIFSMATCHPFFTALGLPVLSGAIATSHIVCWSPALVLLLIKRPFLDRNEGYGFRIWSALMTGVILISFVFDFREAAIYIKQVANLPH